MSLYILSHPCPVFLSALECSFCCLSTLSELLSIQRIENERQQQELERKQKQTEILSLQMMQTLSTTIEAKDEYTRGHSYRVAEYAALIAAELGWSSEEIQQLKHAAYLHDIGKIGISDRILNKAGKLTEEEFEVIKRHPIIGASILKNLALHQDEPIVKVAYEICRWHHERYDGGGYPDGLKGEQIPISAQIVSLADVYDALVSDRIYKKAYSHKEAVRMILAGECGAFNPLLLECLEEIQGKIKEELEVQDVPEISPVPVQCPISEISELSMPEDKR